MITSQVLDYDYLNASITIFATSNKVCDSI